MNNKWNGFWTCWIARMFCVRKSPNQYSRWWIQLTQCAYISCYRMSTLQKKQEETRSPFGKCCKQFAVCIHYLSNIDADADIQCRWSNDTGISYLYKLNFFVFGDFVLHQLSLQPHMRHTRLILYKCITYKVHV